MPREYFGRLAPEPTRDIGHDYRIVSREIAHSAHERLKVEGLSIESIEHAIAWRDECVGVSECEHDPLRSFYRFDCFASCFAFSRLMARRCWRERFGAAS